MISNNMNLIIPTVGATPGPEFASEINNSLTLIDSHDHTTGKGVQITPGGMNINSTLIFNNNFASQLAGLTLLAQSTTPSATSTIYSSGDDLYYVDGIGNNIRITASGGIAGTPGSITGLTSPATASYITGSSTFQFRSNGTIAANMDIGSILLRNLSPNSTFALTLSPSDGLTSNYTIKLPTIPSVQSIVTLDASGNMTAPWTVDNSTIKIVSNQLVGQPGTLSPYREHAWELNGAYSGLTYPLQNIDSIFIVPFPIIIQSVWIYNGDAGSSATTEYDLVLLDKSGVSHGSILSQTGKVDLNARSTVWTDSGSIIPVTAGVQKPIIVTNSIPDGYAIRFDLIQSMGGSPTDARIRIIYTLA
jgi:hypothetical protein